MWDSALDRRELGEAIASRFDGAVTYSTSPRTAGNEADQEPVPVTAVLDWATLHPVERLELLTTHDLARQEKQKLELLRNLLTYYHYATSESREEVLRVEINRVRAPPTSYESATEAVRAPDYSAPESTASESNAPESNAPTASQTHLRRTSHRQRTSSRRP